MIGGGRIVFIVDSNHTEMNISEVNRQDNNGRIISNEGNRSSNEKLEIAIVKVLLKWRTYIDDINFKKMYLDWFIYRSCYVSSRKSRSKTEYTVMAKFFKDPQVIIELLTLMYFFARTSKLSEVIEEYNTLAENYIQAQEIRIQTTSVNDSTHEFRLANIDYITGILERGMPGSVIVEDTLLQHKERAKLLRNNMIKHKGKINFERMIPPPRPQPTPIPRPSAAASGQESTQASAAASGQASTQASLAAKVEVPPNSDREVALGQKAKGKKKRLLFKNIKIKIPKKLSRAFTRFKRMKNRRTTRKVRRRNNKIR